MHIWEKERGGTDVAVPSGSNRGHGCTTKRTRISSRVTFHLMTLQVHEDSIDSVDLGKVANQFVSGNEYRQRMLAKF